MPRVIKEMTSLADAIDPTGTFSKERFHERPYFVLPSGREGGKPTFHARCQRKYSIKDGNEMYERRCGMIIWQVPTKEEQINDPIKCWWCPECRNRHE